MLRHYTVCDTHVMFLSNTHTHAHTLQRQIEHKCVMQDVRVESFKSCQKTNNKQTRILHALKRLWNLAWKEGSYFSNPYKILWRHTHPTVNTTTNRFPTCGNHHDINSVPLLWPQYAEVSSWWRPSSFQPFLFVCPTPGSGSQSPDTSHNISSSV